MTNELTSIIESGGIRSTIIVKMESTTSEPLPPGSSVVLLKVMDATNEAWDKAAEHQNLVNGVHDQ